MSANPRDRLLAPSELSCDSCRSRKAKCDRTIPCCNVCIRTMRSCSYPSKRLKPGPKLGSTHRNGRRRRAAAPPLRESHDAIEIDEVISMDGNRTSIDLENHSVIEEAHPISDFEVFAPGGRQTATQRSQRSLSPQGHAIRPSRASDRIQVNDMMTGITINDADTSKAYLEAMSLSSLIHPDHELYSNPSTSSVSNGETSNSGFLIDLAHTQHTITQVCGMLSISIHTMQKLIDSYFTNMSAFSLFHQPNFGAKVQSIKDPVQLMALLSAMFSFSSRFEQITLEEPDATSSDVDNKPPCQRFHELSLQFIDEAIRNCLDEIPPLCILQATALAAFYQLTSGVRGRSWRLLGTCIRISYELRLHMIDFDRPKSTTLSRPETSRWVFDEERRRCWWMIWEMDTFASTIRRCPTGVDWGMNETYLPVPDEYWFSEQYYPSCCLELKPMERWKRLQETKNESSTAWFIVVNSIMRDAQTLSNLKSVLPLTQPGRTTELVRYFRTVRRQEQVEEDSKQLAILIDSLRCFTSALPKHLVFNGEPLNFKLTAESPSNLMDTRRLSSAKYSIYLMTQLTRFMIYHHNAFGEITNKKILTEIPPDLDNRSNVPAGSSNHIGYLNCLQAADRILFIVNSCDEDHVKHVNPFLASTVWLATALQALDKTRGRIASVELVDSKFQALRANFQEFSRFWDTQFGLLESLDTLGERLKFRRSYASMLAKSVRRKDVPQARDSNPDVETDNLTFPTDIVAASGSGQCSYEWNEDATNSMASGFSTNRFEGLDLALDPEADLLWYMDGLLRVSPLE